LDKDGRRTRATTEGKKKDRRDSLLAAAQELFDSKDFDEISTAEIAGRAGFAKGTLFFYFKTKESLFLELLTMSMQEWFSASVTQIAKAKKSRKTVAKVIASGLVARPNLVRLLALLHPVLERNADTASLLRFKRSLLALTNETALLFEQTLGFNKNTSLSAVIWMHALIIGLAQITTPTRLVRTTLNHPELSLLERDFQNETESALRSLLEGASQEKSHRM
jgi:AcrR family transcriptional regulator